MNKNKILKRFLKLMGFKLEDVLTTEDVISVVTAQVKSKEIKLDDVLAVFDAKNISRDDLHTFVQRVAKQNAWSLYALFGLKDPSLNDVAAKDISKDTLKAFVLRIAAKNNWDVKEMFGLPRKPLTITKVEEQPKPETLKSHNCLKLPAGSGLFPLMSILGRWEEIFMTLTICSHA